MSAQYFQLRPLPCHISGLYHRRYQWIRCLEISLGISISKHRRVFLAVFVWCCTFLSCTVCELVPWCVTSRTCITPPHSPWCRMCVRIAERRGPGTYCPLLYSSECKCLYYFPLCLCASHFIHSSRSVVRAWCPRCPRPSWCVILPYVPSHNIEEQGFRS